MGSKFSKSQTLVRVDVTFNGENACVTLDIVFRDDDDDDETDGDGFFIQTIPISRVEGFGLPWLLREE